MNKKNLIAAVLLYVISSGVSFAAFSFFGTGPGIIETPTPTRTSDGGLDIDPSAPRTEVCPVNGAMYTKVEQAAWAPRRPLAVMIENHTEARPQSGLSEADVVYEAIAEGGITRFMGIFYCDAIAKDVTLAPVRSARTYFLDWASEYGEYPLYAHVGGANTPGPADALGQIQKYGWGGRYGNDLNQFSIGYPTFYRDYDRLDHTVATEHTMVTSTEKLWDVALERGWTNESPEEEDWLDAFEPWSFADAPDAADRGDVSSIAFEFWDGFKQYNVTWNYDRDANVYKRDNGGSAHLDHNTGEQLTTTNVVIQFTEEEGPIDELKHMLYGTVDEGQALIFNNGQVIEANWSKDSRTARTVFTDSSGDDIEFTRGRIWIEILAPGTDIDY